MGEIGIVWTTKEGKEIDIVDITDSHLANIIKFLKKKIEDFGTIPYPYFQGEMAQYCAEQEYEQAEEHLEECHYMLKEMKKEQKRRFNPHTKKE